MGKVPAIVDGGVANNLPVGIARSMGADILIVVDVGYPLAEEEELDSALKVTSQMMTILVRAHTEEQKRLMKPQDVLISPELGGMGSQAFDLTVEAMRLGEATARKSIPALQQLSLSEDAYIAWRRSLHDATADSPVIHRVVVDNDDNFSLIYFLLFIHSKCRITASPTTPSLEPLFP